MVPNGERGEARAGSDEQRVGGHQQRGRACSDHAADRRIDVPLAGGIGDMDLTPQRRRCCLHVLDIGSGVRIVRVGKHADDGRGRYQILQQLKVLRHQRVGEKTHAGHIAARPVHAGDKTEFHRIGSDREYDRDGLRRGLGGECRGSCASGHEHGDPPADQVGGKCRKAIGLIVCPAIFDCDVPAFNEAGLGQSSAKTTQEGHESRSRGRAEKPDDWRRLLRTYGKRPTCCAA